MLENPLRVFGIPLTEVLEREGSEVPMVVARCVQDIQKRGLETEGIFRISGTKDSVQRLREAFDRGEGEELILSDYSIHAVAGMLKQYLGALPEPLLTFQLTEKFIDLLRLQDEDDQLRSAQQLVMQLPHNNRILLLLLLHLLQEVSNNSSKNKMSASNMGIIFGPLLMKDDGTREPLDAMSRVSSFSEVVSYLVSVSQALFMHPPIMKQRTNSDVLRGMVDSDTHLTVTLSTPGSERRAGGHKRSPSYHTPLAASEPMLQGASKSAASVLRPTRKARKKDEPAVRGRLKQDSSSSSSSPPPPSSSSSSSSSPAQPLSPSSLSVDSIRDRGHTTATSSAAERQKRTYHSVKVKSTQHGGGVEASPHKRTKPAPPSPFKKPPNKPPLAPLPSQGSPSAASSAPPQVQVSPASTTMLQARRKDLPPVPTRTVPTRPRRRSSSNPNLLASPSMLSGMVFNQFKPLPPSPSRSDQ
eukprot:TRINITY_DN1061_c1_g2_i1.p1 TRINITY_DN1061_c1_g2~~TRINITY_DN1061_c1_g2_i1.p1  ORF type:complete len:516 (+),score=135.94 TRINITY_DN1061_c1_g2_i1:138-1550(+)